MTFKQVEESLTNGLNMTEEERKKCLEWIEEFAKRHEMEPEQMDDWCYWIAQQYSTK